MLILIIEFIINILNSFFGKLCTIPSLHWQTRHRLWDGDEEEDEEGDDDDSTSNKTCVCKVILVVDCLQ